MARKPELVVVPEPIRWKGRVGDYWVVGLVAALCPKLAGTNEIKSGAGQPNPPHETCAEPHGPRRYSATDYWAECIEMPCRPSSIGIVSQQNQARQNSRVRQHPQPPLPYPVGIFRNHMARGNSLSFYRALKVTHPVSRTVCRGLGGAPIANSLTPATRGVVSAQFKRQPGKAQPPNSTHPYPVDKPYQQQNSLISDSLRNRIRASQPRVVIPVTFCL